MENRKNIRRLLAIAAVLVSMLVLIAWKNIPQPFNIPDLIYVKTGFPMVNNDPLANVPFLRPNLGEITYNCPTANSCVRSGSQEWFSVSGESFAANWGWNQDDPQGYAYQVELIGSAFIVSVEDGRGNEIPFYTFINGVIVFEQPISGDVLIHTSGTYMTGNTAYGIR